MKIHKVILLILPLSLASCVMDESLFPAAGPVVGPTYQAGGYYGGGYPGPTPVYGIPHPVFYSNVRILSARWESKRRGVDVTGVVQQMVNEGQFRIRADNRTFGVDPDKGQHKTLTIRYRTRSGDHIAVGKENEDVRLKAD